MTDKEHFEALITTLFATLDNYLTGYAEGVETKTVQSALLYVTVSTFADLQPDRRRELMERYLHTMRVCVEHISELPVPNKKEMH